MISGNLEYLMSSLPSLYFSDSESFQHEVDVLINTYAFYQQDDQHRVTVLMEEASKFLSGSELRVLKKINLEGIYKKEFRTSTFKVVREFSEFVWQLKMELSNYRRARLMEGTSDKTKYDLLVDLSKDPLQAEQQLLALHWEKLEELSVGHYSDLSALILYKLKLEILERFWSFDQKIGYERFQQLLNSSSDG